MQNRLHFFMHSISTSRKLKRKKKETKPFFFRTGTEASTGKDYLFLKQMALEYESGYKQRGTNKVSLLWKV